jgi:superfamily II DNA/RNA helicase
VLYNLAASYGGFYDEVVHAIESLQLTPYRLESYRKTKDAEVEKTIQRQEALVGIFKTTFLKRLESSVKAFETSIRDQMEFQTGLLQHLKERGRLLGAADFRRTKQLVKSEDDDRLARAQDVIESLDEVDREAYKLSEIQSHVEADVSSLTGILEALNTLTDCGNQDAKLDEVKGFIRKRLASSLKERKLLLFTYFRETAEYIYKAITDDKAWIREMGTPRIEIITGNTDGERRSTIVRQFAPFSNRPQEEEREGWQPPADQIDILISTDVLSEGQNLQDCGDLLNYDLHWNSVRMIQRAGRINRLKALHDLVYVYNCYPDKELNNLLRIVERLQQRVRDIDQSVALDHSVMGEIISDKSFDQLRRIREWDAQVIDELEQQAELGTVDS